MATRRPLIRRVILAILVIGVLKVLYIGFWPVPITPVVWYAPHDPTGTGAFERNELLSAMEMVPILDARGPEDLAVDSEGRIYAATVDGRIIRIAADGTSPEAWVNTGGRPLGMAFDATGTLWVADAERGLLAIAADGAIRVAAATTSAGDTIRLVDELDVASDGRIYMSDASTRFHAPDYTALEASLLEILEHEGTGRLLEHDPSTGATTVLHDGLVFANGVVMSHDQQSVLVAETGSYRVLRIWRDGPRRGEADILIEALPGFPDNISRGLDGRYWIALVSPRNALVDRLSARPFARTLIQRLPAFVRPKPVHFGHVLAVDDSGRVVADLQDPSGRLPMLTTAIELPATAGRPAYLYLGSLEAPTAARVRWDAP
jgi:sugar lactone lactonase YvrE